MGDRQDLPRPRHHGEGAGHRRLGPVGASRLRSVLDRRRRDPRWRRRDQDLRRYSCLWLRRLDVLVAVLGALAACRSMEALPSHSRSEEERDRRRSRRRSQRSCFGRRWLGLASGPRRLALGRLRRIRRQRRSRRRVDLCRCLCSAQGRRGERADSIGLRWTLWRRRIRGRGTPRFRLSRGIAPGWGLDREIPGGWWHRSRGEACRRHPGHTRFPLPINALDIHGQRRSCLSLGRPRISGFVAGFSS